MSMFSFGQFSEVLEAQAPDLIKTVRELAEKAGVAVPKILIPDDSYLESLKDVGKQSLFPQKEFVDFLAATDGKGIIYLGGKVRELLNHPTLDAPVSEELKAVLSHEIGHVKYKDTIRGMPIANISPIAGMAVAIGALAIYEWYQKKKKKEADAKQKGEKHEPGSTEAVLSNLEPDAGQSKWLSGLWRCAKYLAVSAIGFGVGLFAMKTIYGRMEFRADNFSAEQMESGKPLARALDILQKHIGSVLDASATRMRGEGVSEGSINRQRKIFDWSQAIMHPDMATRIDKMNSWTKG